MRPPPAARTARIGALHLVYDLVYAGVLAVASPYFLWTLLTSRRRRRGLAQRLGRLPPLSPDRPRIWIHGVSVGEVLAAKSLVESIERELPGHEIVLSTTTDTGQEVARKHYPGRTIFYFPLDFSFAAKRALRRIRPAAIVLMELEIWPNFLLASAAADVPVLLVNGRISERSFRRYGVLQRVIPEPMDRIGLYCVQTDRYAERFRSLGVRPDRVHVTGTMKYDVIRTEGAAELREAARAELSIGPGERVFMGGSTHPTEEEALFDAWNAIREVRPEYRLVVAPRHPERLDEVEARLSRRGAAVVRKTRLAGTPRGNTPPVVLVDTMGELARLYAAADLVFVGGTLVPHGGQNMMEPAGLGRPVILGPHVVNFADSVELLLDARAVVMVRDAAELQEAARRLAADPEGAAAMGERARRMVAEQQGASKRILELIRPYLVGDRRGTAGTNGKGSVR